MWEEKIKIKKQRVSGGSRKKWYKMDFKFVNIETKKSGKPCSPSKHLNGIALGPYICSTVILGFFLNESETSMQTVLNAVKILPSSQKVEGVVLWVMNHESKLACMGVPF